MNKSVIIIVALLWFLCTLYYTLARAYGYAYVQAAMLGAWAMSALLLVCIVVFVRRQSRK